MNSANWKKHLLDSLTLASIAIFSDNSFAIAVDSKTAELDSTTNQSAAKSSIQDASQISIDKDNDEKTDAQCWQIVVDNFASLTRMTPKQIQELFGTARTTIEKDVDSTIFQHENVLLDKNTVLKLSSGLMYVDEISLMPSTSDPKTINRRLDKEFGAHDWENDSVYTYAPRKQEDYYWAILKANLKVFLGMKKDELITLLGPERCSSQLRQTLDYRVGCERLRFFLVNDRVAFLQRVTGIYEKPGLFKQEVLPAPVTVNLWPIFEDKVDTLLGLNKEAYQRAMNISKTEIPLTIDPHKTQRSFTTIRSFVPQRLNGEQFWYLDDRIRASVSMESGLVNRIVFEPWQIAEDRALPHGAAETGWGALRPSGVNAVYTGAKRRDEATYWTAIKPNLRKLIGMKKQEIVALLGPERCFSEAGKSIDYRIGINRLRFFMRNDAVIGFVLTYDMYLHGT
ncbi:MAG: hypothetical protein WCT03_18860 [Candidatus Obscuribacterales bacterium]|jgi:hypothetical protein